MELKPKDPSTAILILSNTTTKTWSHVTVTPVTDEDLNVVGQPAFSDERTIAAGGELDWLVVVSNKTAAPNTGAIIFRIEYRVCDGRRMGVPHVAYVTLPVGSRNVSELAEVRVETALESLDAQHPGKVYLVITNKSNESLTVKQDEITWDKPNFIQIPARQSSAGTKNDAAPLVFAPRQTMTVSFDVGTADRVQSGKHLLVARVPFEWGGPANAQKRNVVVTKEIQVGVLGESALLKILAVPSFLMIPGFIGVIIWGVLWKWGLFKTRTDSGDFPLQFSEKPTNPQFWVAAITTSIPVILIYRWLVNPDVLGLYGLSDLVAIWLASVVFLGLGGYALIIGGRRLYLLWTTPSEKDKQLDILKKLERQGLEVFLPQVTFTRTGAAEPRRALLLQKKDNSRPRSWVGPKIRIVWHATATADMKTAVNEERKLGGSPGKIVEAIKRAGQSVELSWKPNEAQDVTELLEVETANLQFGNVDEVIEVVEQ